MWGVFASRALRGGARHGKEIREEIRGAVEWFSTVGLSGYGCFGSAAILLIPPSTAMEEIIHQQQFRPAASGAALVTANTIRRAVEVQQSSLGARCDMCFVVTRRSEQALRLLCVGCSCHVQPHFSVVREE